MDEAYDCTGMAFFDANSGRRSRRKALCPSDGALVSANQKNYRGVLVSHKTLDRLRGYAIIYEHHEGLQKRPVRSCYIPGKRIQRDRCYGCLFAPALLWAFCYLTSPQPGHVLLH